MQLHIDELKQGEKSVRIKSNGETYFVQNKNAAGLTPGITIEAVINESEYQGKTMLWVNSWRPTQIAPTPVAQPATTVANTRTDDRWWMPFVSNTVAHAIAAGKIEEPGYIKLWAAAAYEAANSLGKPGIDGDVPFKSVARENHVKNTQLSQEATEWLKGFDETIDPMKAIMAMPDDIP